MIWAEIEEQKWRFEIEGEKHEPSDLQEGLSLIYEVNYCDVYPLYCADWLQIFGVHPRSSNKDLEKYELCDA